MNIQKPREKLMDGGPSSLEDHELLALIFSRGNIKENVHELGRRILGGFDREEILAERNFENLKKSLNLGLVQTCQLMAAIELGRRFFLKEKTGKRITATGDAYELLRPMQYLHKEYVRGLYMNSRYEVIHDEIITIGSLDGNILHPREVFRPALECGAYALIMAHNHPSGDPAPSGADIDSTKKLMEAGDLMQIPLLDHLVIGLNSFTSMKKNGLI
jgi:DNA repair protein RadC